jgi:hypothetical protein
LNSILAFIRREPAVVTTVGAAVLGLAVSFGLPLTLDEKASIDAFLTVIAGVIVRSQVTPVAK